MNELLVRGKLEQVCPTCGVREAAGTYCTACATPTGARFWTPGAANPGRVAAMSKRRANAAPGTANPGTAA